MICATSLSHPHTSSSIPTNTQKLPTHHSMEQVTRLFIACSTTQWNMVTRLSIVYPTTQWNKVTRLSIAYPTTQWNTVIRLSHAHIKLVSHLEVSKGEFVKTSN